MDVATSYYMWDWIGLDGYFQAGVGIEHLMVLNLSPVHLKYRLLHDDEPRYLDVNFMDGNFMRVSGCNGMQYGLEKCS